MCDITSVSFKDPSSAKVQGKMSKTENTTDNKTNLLIFI